MTTEITLAHAVGCARTGALEGLLCGRGYRIAGITFHNADGVTSLHRSGVQILSYSGSFTRETVIADLKAQVKAHRDAVLAHVLDGLRAMGLPDGYGAAVDFRSGHLNTNLSCENLRITSDRNVLSNTADKTQFHAHLRVFFDKPQIRYCVLSGQMFSRAGEDLLGNGGMMVGGCHRTYAAAIQEASGAVARGYSALQSMCAVS